ncbi:MAG: GNAT family N-acetyltransferase [Streptosporangiaceae bacterium]
MPACRLITPDDAPVLAGLVRANRDFLAPWEPVRGDEQFTEAGQRVAIQAALDEHAHGRSLPCVMVDGDGAVVGRVNLNTIVRGASQSASLGYWLAEAAGGRGVATAAVRDITRLAFAELGLHRIQADTLVHNVPSERVLARTGFVRIGMAARYLKIAGRWQDCILHQLVYDAAS